MSTDPSSKSAPVRGPSGLPELTPLGKRIEVLRIQRGLSKQHLARYAGASRQQLWRVLTGKSELTPALAARVADALAVPVDALRDIDAVHGRSAEDSRALADLLRDPAALAGLLQLLPPGVDGLRLRRALIDVAEELCLHQRIQVPPELFALRQRVLSGALDQ